MSSFTTTFIFLLFLSLTTSTFVADGHYVMGAHDDKPSRTLRASDPTLLIRKTCARTSHKDICLRTFAAEQYADQADIYGLVNISIAAAFRKASDSGDYIDKLLNGNHSSEVQQCITRCSKCWEDSYNLAEHAINVLWCTGDIKKAIRCMTIAAERTDVCKESCVAAKEKGNDQLADMNLELKQLCTISAEVIEMLPESSMVLV